MKTIQNQPVMSQKAVKNEKQCQILWDTVDEEKWETYFDALPQSSLLQSPDYTRVVSGMNNQKIRRGLIMLDGKEAGILQILEAAAFKKAIHAVILDRGPLWFEGYGSAENFSEFLSEFSAEFPKRFGRRIRIIPETKKADQICTVLSQYNFQRKGAPYETIITNLNVDERKMRSRLSSRWKRHIKKADKSNMVLLWSDEGKNFAWLMQNYIKDRKEKKYDGASPQTLIKLADQFSRGKNMVLGTALLEGQPIAAILLLIHGKSATYQIGYTSDKGRECCAHHLLLFKAQSVLKERELNDFDLGGVNEGSAKGVKSFKEGLGGTLITMPGLYCR